MELVESNILEQFLGVTAEQLQHLVRRGMPKEKNGKYDFLKCIKWQLNDMQNQVGQKAYLSRHEVAELLGFKNKKYVNVVEAEYGLPKESFNKYDMKKVIKWFLDHREEIHRKEIEKIKEGNSRERLERGRAELIEMEIAIKHGTLVDSRHLEDALNNEVSLYVRGLEVLKTKMANLLNLNAQQKEIIETEINSIRNQIGNLPADKSVSDIKFI